MMEKWELEALRDRVAELFDLMDERLEDWDEEEEDEEEMELDEELEMEDEHGEPDAGSHRSRRPRRK